MDAGEGLELADGVEALSAAVVLDGELALVFFGTRQGAQGGR